jgi:hypothetical protein
VVLRRQGKTWLRLLPIDAGLPKQTTQIPVSESWRMVGLLDMGWEEFMVAAEYDGDQHRTDRRQIVKDISSDHVVGSMFGYHPNHRDRP